MKRPIRDCGQLEAVLWLAGGALFALGAVVFALSIRGMFR